MPGTTHQQPAKPSTGKGKILPALCNIFGTLLLAAVIALCVPLTVPIAMGYQVYDVISGSMEPAIPVGSAIYVQSVDPSEIVVGDVVAYQDENGVIAHRVTLTQESKLAPLSVRDVLTEILHATEVPYLGTQGR
jgi:signal peptidase